MKSCKNCEWAGYCTFDDNAVMCERDGSEYIPANKMQETAEKCVEYEWLKQPHTDKEKNAKTIQTKN
jgi:hypothetical protein